MREEGPSCSEKMGDVDFRKLTLTFVSFFLEKGCKSIRNFPRRRTKRLTFIVISLKYTGIRYKGNAGHSVKQRCVKVVRFVRVVDKRHWPEFGIITMFLWIRGTVLSLVLLQCFCG